MYVLDHNWPEDVTIIFCLVVPFCEPQLSTAFTTLMPSMTLPKTTCLPSSQGVGAVVMKNWDPLVLGPAFAIERAPGPSCLILKFSSANFSPQIDFPPVPLCLVKSPPWSMKPGMTLWKIELAKPKPFSPVQRARKFSAVLGQVLAQSSMVILPRGLLSAETSKKHLGLFGSDMVDIQIIFEFGQLSTNLFIRAFNCRLMQVLKASCDLAGIAQHSKAGDRKA